MDIKYWDGGLQIQEIKAIEKIKKAFSEPTSVTKASSKKTNPSKGGSLGDQLAGLGLGNKPVDPMLSWKGYAGFRFVDARGNDGEFDLLIVTHCIILIIELKDWNYGKIESRGDKWFKNDKEMDRSPVSVTRNKKFLVENKLKSYRQKFTNKGFVPQVHFLVVMCGNADISGIKDEEKKYTLKINEFLKLKNERSFDQRFRPHPNSKVLLNDISFLDKVFFDNESKVQPKQYAVNGYKATDLIFTHPTKVYCEYQAKSESNDQALLRLWDFSKLDKVEAKTPEGRYSIVSREREVLQFIKDQNYDLYQHCLRSLTSIQTEDITNEYSELYELPPSHVRFNEFIGKYGEGFSEQSRFTLVKLLIAKFADLHEMKVAHRDLGDHSIWMSPSKQVALSNFISAYHQPIGTVGDFREALSVNEGVAPEGMEVGKATTPFQIDIYTLSLLSWHILQANRLSPNSMKTAREEIDASNAWYAPVIMQALDGRNFKYAKDFFDTLKKEEPSSKENFDFDVEALSPFQNSINHSRQFRDDLFITETNSKEVYQSNGLLVKAWLNIDPANDKPALGNKVLHFCQQVSKLQSSSLSYLPCIRDYGLATKSSSLYLVTDYIVCENWSKLSKAKNDVEKQFEIINKLISSIEHLHGLGISHGDLHPENVKVDIEKSDVQVYLLDIPDFSFNSEQPFNHRYSPENIDGCTSFERDNFAVMRMSYELLGIEWGESSEAFPSIDKAIEVELQDIEFGFRDLSRFKDAINSTINGKDDAIDVIEISIKGDFEPFTIYPDNGSLFVYLEKNKKNESEARVTFMGVGGQVPLIFSSEQSQFIVGFKPRTRSTVHYRDVEKSQLELPFAIQVNSGMGFELSDLTHKVEDYDEFQRAIDAILLPDNDEALESTEGTREDASVSEADMSFLLLEDDLHNKALDAKQSDETAPPEESKTLRLKNYNTVKVSTSELWQAVLSTETESHPFVTVQGDVNRPKNTKDELIIRYSSEFNVLDKFNKKDDIEAIQVIDDKNVRLGTVLLNKSGLDEVRLSKVSHKALALEENDVIYFRSRQDKASYQKRKNALERLLNREGVISNLIDYFDPESSIKDTPDYPIDVSDDDFSRYDRIDDHGNTISLNTQQREAFQQLLQNGQLSLLQGPPGTGKTEFIAAFAHYLIEKQNVKNILLVSQSHEAVNTAAERIRKHCSRLDTPLEVVRFSNREGAVSDGLKDVYSNAIVTEKRELFRAEITHRVQALSQAFGLQPEYLADLIKAEFSLFKKVNQLISFVETPSGDDEEDKLSIKKSIHQLEESIQQVLLESYDMDYLGKESLSSIKAKVLMQLDQAYAIQPNESQRAKALVKVSIDMLEVLETDRVNYDEFLARSRQLVTGTCVGIGQWHIDIAENQYDWVIIDEAARSIASELAIAMQSAKRVLLVGDHKQLPPLYSTPHKKALARKLGIASDDAESILRSDFAQAFESSYGQQAGAKLLTQYRMAKPIGNLVSNVFYNDELQNGERVIPNKYVDVPEAIKSTVTWIDTSLMKNAYHQKPNRGSSIYNRCETDEIIALLSDISKETDFVDNLISIVKENEPAIGIICMYAEQKKLLLKKFKEQIWQDNFKSLIKIDTVDSYQGKENRIIILSITRNIKNQSPGFLRSPNRINVAISRAMDKLVIVGATDMWKAQNDDLPLGKVFRYIEERNDSSDFQIIKKKGEK